MLSSLLFAACATMPARQKALNQNLSWAQRQQQLATITAWQIKGSIGGHTPRQGFSANVVWRQRQDKRYQITIFGPLGVGMTRLDGNASAVTLTNANNQTFSASKPEQLIQQQLGWSLPVSNLYYWIRGLPAPGNVEISKFDAYHHLIELKQQGWQINYRQYAGVDGKVDLPVKLSMRYGDLDLRLVISQWLINH